MEKIIQLILYVVVFFAVIHWSKAARTEYCDAMSTNCQSTETTVSEVSTLSYDDTEILGTIEFEEEESLRSEHTVDVRTLTLPVSQIQNEVSLLTQTSTQNVPPTGYEIVVQNGAKYCKTSCEWFADLQIVNDIKSVALSYTFNPGQLCGSCTRPYVLYLLSSIPQQTCFSIADIQAGRVSTKQLNLIKNGCSLSGVCSCTNDSIQNPAQLTLLSTVIKTGHSKLITELIGNMSSITKQMQKQYDTTIAQFGADLAPVVTKIEKKNYELENAYETAAETYEANPTWANYNAYVSAYDAFYEYYETIETLYGNAFQPLDNVALTYTHVLGDMVSKMKMFNKTVNSIASALLARYGNDVLPTAQQIQSVTKNITSWFTSLSTLTNHINSQAISTFNAIIYQSTQYETKSTVEEAAASVQFYHKKIQKLHSSEVESAKTATTSNSNKVMQ